MKRTADDIERALEIQRKAITASCKAYDAGEKWEALRLATALYTLMHDGGKIVSVLSHANAKIALWYVASGRLVNQKLMNNFHRSTCLLELDTDSNGNSEFVPLCKYYEDRAIFFPFRLLRFKEWWETDIIYFDRKNRASGELYSWIRARPEKTKKKEKALYYKKNYVISGDIIRLSCRQLVFALRNQEGGSHYDAELLNPNYTPLIEPSYMFTRPKLNVCRDLELATMRQIAEEVRLTLMLNGAKDIGDFPLAMAGFTKGRKWIQTIYTPLKKPQGAGTPC